MNLGPESETAEHKRSTSELKEGAASVAAILNKHERGELFFGVRNDGEEPAACRRPTPRCARPAKP